MRGGSQSQIESDSCCRSFRASLSRRVGPDPGGVECPGAKLTADAKSRCNQLRGDSRVAVYSKWASLYTAQLPLKSQIVAKPPLLHRAGPTM
jgi:hypothetical protein